MKPTGGTFTIHAHGLSSEPIPYDANPEKVLAVYKKLSTRVAVQQLADRIGELSTEGRTRQPRRINFHE